MGIFALNNVKLSSQQARWMFNVFMPTQLAAPTGFHPAIR